MCVCERERERETEKETERKEMFYLMTHSTLFYSYLGLDIIMIKDHSDSKRGNPLLPHGLFFLISNKGFHMHHPTDRTAHTTTFFTPVVEQWLE